MTYTDFDLSTAILYYGSVYANGAIGDDANGSTFSFPDFLLDPLTSYEFQVDVVVPADWTATTVRSFALASQGSAGPDASNWSTLGGIPVPGSGTYSVTIGPGVESWGGAVADGENRVTFTTGRLKVTGLRWQAVARLVPIFATDTSYANDGYAYGGTAAVDYAAPAAPPPPGVVRQDVRRVHQSLPTPTLVKGRPQ